ncbi:hypothetical protein PYW07_012549 [Mythimna separata]|uniref:Uncharacterized protein n=1 Tax=Mythimna separata TaxID=271217 RepID=A0AAD7Y8I5_MYTSE|nr:hypothetical protein PYW07_012549 [Mythimna separata]
MEKLSLCRICLVENVRMYVVTDKILQEVYEKLTDIPFITEDSRPMLACFFCYAKLKQCCQFKRKCLEADDLFAQILNQDNEISLSKIKREPDYLGGFIKTSIQHISIVDAGQSDSDAIKEELPAVCERLVEGIELKVEHHSDDLGPDNADHSYPDIEDTAAHHSESDSEDDVPLMKFKTEVEEEQVTTKKKRVKSKTRKPDCSEIILSKKEQFENLLARSKTANYMHSPFKCDLCYKGFVDARAYENHKIKHDVRSGAHVCDICRMHYQTVQLLRTHANNAHVRIFRCNKCGFVCHTGNQARIHEKWHNGHTYECQLCSHTFRKPTSYFSHMRKRHPTEHVCNICGETFVGKHGLQMHKRKTHVNGEKMVDPNDPEDPASKRFCSECNIQFYNSEAWKRHILCSVKHTLKTEESKTCSICPWKYIGNVSLETHMKEHAKALRRSRKPPATAKERIFRCNQCGSNFMTRSKLQAHINRTHLGLKYNKNIVCEVCGKKCTSNATLKYHQRTHTGEKPYSCSSCSKHFVDSNQLRIHTRTHTGEKPYVCAHCGKRFTQKPALNRHYRVHTGAKPYTCQYCSRTFSQSNSLKLHVRTVHLKQPANSRKSKAKPVTQDTKLEKDCEKLETEASLQNIRVFVK